MLTSGLEGRGFGDARNHGGSLKAARCGNLRQTLQLMPAAQALGAEALPTKVRGGLRLSGELLGPG